MKPLITQKKDVTTDVNQDVLNDIAIELLKGNHKTIEWGSTRDFHEVEFEISLLVKDGYVVTIRQTKIGGMI